MLPVPSPSFETTITSRVSPGATQIYIDSVVDSAGGSLNGQVLGFTLEKGSAREEFILGTVDAATASLLSVKKITISTGEAGTDGCTYDHGAKAKIEITDFPYLTQVIRSLNGTKQLDADYVPEFDAAPSLTPGSNQFCTVKYADDLALAGSPNATETQKGIEELATEAEFLAGTDIGGTGASLSVVPSKIAKAIQNSSFIYGTSSDVYSPAYLTGDTGAQTAAALWAAVTNGSFRITINGTSYNVDGINFTGVADMNSVATKIQTAIRALTSSLETVTWSTNRFIISSVNTTYISAITVLSTSTGTVGTDISGAGASDWMDADSGNGVVTAATFPGYSASTIPTISALQAGQIFLIKLSAQNLGSQTLNISSKGAKTIKKNTDQNLEAGDLKSGMMAVFQYDGTYMQLLNQQGSMPTTAILSEMSTFFGATDITGAEAETLTSGVTSNADSLHKHTLVTNRIEVWDFQKNSTSDDTDRTQLVSSSDGQYLYAVTATGTSPNNNINIIRYTRDAETGMYYLDGYSGGLSQSSSEIGSLAENGVGAWCGNNYVWVATRDGSNYTVIYRFNKDLTGKQKMTMSANISETPCCSCGSDSVAYISSQTDDHWLTYTLSGTTATQGTDITDASGVTAANRGGGYFDGTYIYYMDTNSSYCPIKKINLSGTVQSTTTYRGFMNSGTTPNSKPVGRGLCYRNAYSIAMVGYCRLDTGATEYILLGYGVTKP